VTGELEKLIAGVPEVDLPDHVVDRCVERAVERGLQEASLHDTRPERDHPDKGRQDAPARQLDLPLSSCVTLTLG
jgi:hypothetical protein